jgi:hypothetical protein
MPYASPCGNKTDLIIPTPNMRYIYKNNEFIPYCDRNDQLFTIPIMETVSGNIQI